jgi:hypothetical protein
LTYFALFLGRFSFPVRDEQKRPNQLLVAPAPNGFGESGMIEKRIARVAAGRDQAVKERKAGSGV